MKPGGERGGSLWTEYIYKQIEEEEGELAESGENMLLVWWFFFLHFAGSCSYFSTACDSREATDGFAFSRPREDNQSGYCCYLCIEWWCLLCTAIRDWISETKQQQQQRARETARPPFSVFECHDLFTKQAAVFAFIIHVTVTQAERNNDNNSGAVLICKVVRTRFHVRDISIVRRDWTAQGIEKQQSHSTVRLANCWFGISFLTFKLSHPITARRGPKLRLVFLFCELGRETFGEVFSHLRLVD